MKNFWNRPILGLLPVEWAILLFVVLAMTMERT